MPIVVDADDPTVIIDGHHRKRIADELGKECPILVTQFDDDAHRLVTALRLNSNRRHLTANDRRKAIGNYLKQHTKTNDNQLSKMIGCSHNTVKDVRAELVKNGDIPTIEEFKGNDGKLRPYNYKTVFANSPKLTKRLPPTTPEEWIEGLAVFMAPIHKAYEHYFKRDEAHIRQKIGELEDKHTTLTERILNLDPAKANRAIEKANERISALEQGIEQLKGTLKNWSAELQRVREETYSHVMSLVAAEDLLDDPKSDNRRKAQAVLQCIEKINLTFRSTGKKYPKSELVNVEIFPNSGHIGERPNGALR